MKAKALLFVLGIATGVAIFYAVNLRQARARKTSSMETIRAEAGLQSAELRSALTDAQREMRRLEMENANLLAKVDELRKGAPKAPAPTNSAATTNMDETPVAALVKLFSEEKDTNAVAGAMGKFMKAALHQRIDSRVEILKAKLDLAPVQEQALRDIWEKEVDTQQGMAMKVLGGKLKEEDTKEMEKNTLDVRDEIKRTLTAEQWAGFQQFEKEERASMARVVANSELLELQEILPLTPGKQEQLLAVLLKQAEGQFNDSQQPGGIMRAMNWEQQLTAKKEAMRSVLTIAEFKIYEKHLEGQAQMMKAFVPPVPKNQARAQAQPK
jgi:hypothetical protein